jgi:ribosomal protein L44E
MAVQAVQAVLCGLPAMVHHPKTKKLYCKFCKKHQVHKVAAASRSDERKVALERR